MHIALFSDYTFNSLGGLQSSLRAQCFELLKQGHRVTFVCPDAPDQHSMADGPNFVGVKPIPFPITGYMLVLPNLKTTSSTINTLRQLESIDIIHCHTNMGVGIIAIAASKSLGVPLVQSFHGREDIVAEKNPFLPRTTAWLLSTLHSYYLPHTKRDTVEGSYMSKQAWAVMQTHASHTRHIIVPSKHFLKVFRAHGYTGPATVISNGIEDILVETIARTKPVKRQRPLIMWAGRLWPEKRPELLVEAARLLPEYDFAMYGDGILRSKIQSTLPENVSIFTDCSQKDVLFAMKSATLFVLTSKNFDTQSMVLLESIVANLPAIIMDKNLRETIPSAGSELAEGDYNELARSIKKLVTNKNKLRQMQVYLRSIRPSVMQSQKTYEAVTVYTKVCNEKPRQ